MKKFSDLLGDLTWWLEFENENKFRTRALKGAVDLLDEMSSDQMKRIAEGQESIKGIGDGIRTLMKEYIEHGRLQELETISSKYPKTLPELKNVSGLGPVRIRTLFNEGNINSLESLHQACVSGKIKDFSGFGEKVVEKLFATVELLLDSKNSYLIAEASIQAGFVLEHLLSQGISAQFAGELARHCEVIKRPMIKADADQRTLQDLLSIFKAEKTPAGFITYPHPTLPVLVLGNDGESFQELTAPQGLNPPSTIPPYLWEFECQEVWRKPPKPLELAQIKGTFHCHTIYSDGRHSVVEMAEKARKNGWSFLAISDHSKTAFYANGMKEHTVSKQHKEIDELNKRYSDFTIFKSCETDILSNGDVDFHDTIIDNFDFVIASIHGQFSSGDQTERVLKALDHPKVKMIGHVTGRLLLERPGYFIDVASVIRKAASLNKIVELNCNPHRMDIDWRFGPIIRETGMLVSINPDAHSMDGLDDMVWGVQVGRKLGIPSEQIINTWNVEKVRELLVRN